MIGEGRTPSEREAIAQAIEREAYRPPHLYVDTVTDLRAAIDSIDASLVEMQSCRAALVARLELLTTS